MISGTVGVVGLLFFFAFFVGLTLWLYVPKAAREYQKYASIPLNEEQSK